jgi:uncharacterized glyoxalase superfamily protein PhnB
MPDVQPVPDGFRTITPHIVIRDARRAIEWYRQAFGAEVISICGSPDEPVPHAEIRIGDSVLMICDEFPDMGIKSPLTLGGSPIKLHLYVPDVDAWFKRAMDAGAKPTMPVQDMFWGDRYGKIADPFGHEWGIATHKEDVSPEEIERRSVEAMKTFKSGQGGTSCCGSEHG